MKQNTPFPYEDLLSLPYPRPTKRARMSMVERAAQFAPFAALTGYDAVIRETARLTGKRIELDENEKVELDRKLQKLASLPRPVVTLTYYIAESRKEGGAYVTCTGILKKTDPYSRSLILEDGSSVRMEDILELESPLFLD